MIRLRVADRRAVARIVGRSIPAPCSRATLARNAARSPSGGEISVVAQPMTRSPGNSAPPSAQASSSELPVCPGVASAVSVQPGPATLAPSPIRRSGRKPASIPSPPPSAPAAASAAIAGERAPAGSPCASKRRAYAVGEGARARAVVAVRVGHEHRRHPLSPERRRERREMARVVGAGVDHRHLARADDVAAGAGEGHRPPIRRGHHAQPGRQDLRDPDRRRVAEVENGSAKRSFLARPRPRA